MEKLRQGQISILTIAWVGGVVLLAVLALFIGGLVRTVQHQTLENAGLQALNRLQIELNTFSLEARRGAQGEPGTVQGLLPRASSHLETQYTDLLDQMQAIRLDVHGEQAPEAHQRAYTLLRDHHQAWLALQRGFDQEESLPLSVLGDQLDAIEIGLHKVVAILANEAFMHSNRLLNVLYGGSVVALLGFVLLAWMLVYFKRQVAVAQRIVTAMGEGRLDARLPLPGGGAEITRMNQEVNRMADNLGRQLRLLDTSVVTLEQCIGNMGESRQWLLKDAQANREMMALIKAENNVVTDKIKGIYQAFNTSSDHVTQVAQGAEVLSREIAVIAQSTEDAAQSVCTITTETELMNMSIDGVQDVLGRVNCAVDQVGAAVTTMNVSMEQVRTLCLEANGQSRAAVGRAEETTRSMQRFAAAAHEIEKVIQVIDNIADQTNMLALNAAIEAAGAGDMGRGFSVVANEVKELARQTADATRKIYQSVAELLDSSDQAGKAVAGIVGAIHTIGSSIVAIDNSTLHQAGIHEQIHRAMDAVSLATSEATGLVQDLKGSSSQVFQAATEAANHTKEVAKVAAAVVSTAQQLEASGQSMKMTSESVLDAELTIEAFSNTIQEQIQEICQRTQMTHAAVFHVASSSEELERIQQQMHKAREHFTFQRDPFLLEDDPRSAHLLWFGELVAMIRGKIPVDRSAAADANGCRFSHWLQRKNHQESSISFNLFKAMEQLHQQIHCHGETLMTCLEQGAMDQALEQLEQLAQKKGELFGLIEQTEHP